ncbi:ExbD/TolR family protein [Marinomonas mediterranea]|jgi:Biopolymer transport protein|uniref:Biopolymer transport protein ExbD/TolR n=1 Tax=Marinomonas mediterranea (strain ATCC 700492 / JCM 21426 / NBRC 103028 / MMB-1) TaxID=717774 RepID=F2K398_MARM1|nr:biopolymer transporter ExbD [Marinomonas mediterranea]ADZ91240.1 Biopolymer transport protein ExbD/TolR [Marinomonas mediterranea MMB-1]WCN09213.1 biopolymer transporter ExbD [Marinomonas mediterranea]WCN13296.1 biopolymer transporter ExbD [Marinomonas mediterranea]WCN17364.1 biopolymer transporter ExbD [Marinomonas mediterranea MMB-1]
MKFRRQKIEDVQINLTPLIDVVFLLLIFFMVSTTFKQSTELTIDLPSASSDAPSLNAQDPIEITITSDGQYVINGQTLVNEQVSTLVQGIKETANEKTDDMPLVITADAQAPYELVLRVYDAASQLGIYKIAHTAEREEQ